MRVGPGSSLMVHCRTKQFCRDEDKVFEVKDIPLGAAGVMVITRYSKAESLAFWESQVIPQARKFCRVMTRLFFDKSYQQLFMTSQNQDDWYNEYKDEA